MTKLNPRVNFYLYGMPNAPSCALIINDSNGGNNGKIQGKIHGNYTQKLPTINFLGICAKSFVY